jgi:hypothetical protein
VLVLLEPLGLDDELDAALPDGEGEVVVVVSVDFELLLLEPGVVVEGEADGDVLPGRLLTRSELDSVQPAAIPAMSASAQNPETYFFISVAPPP